MNATVTYRFHAPDPFLAIASCTCILSSSICLQQGGAIFIAEGGEVKFLNDGSVYFTESYAEGNGGAIANYGSLVVKRPAVFEDNESLASGGAIYSDSATSEML